jgi:hypothetical protein
VGIPRRRLPIVANPMEELKEGIIEEEQRGANMGGEITVKFKILFHFIKGNISLTPMESHGDHSYNSKRTRIFGRIG